MRRLALVVALLLLASRTDGVELLFPPTGGGGISTTIPFPIAIGGTHQTAFTASTCVQVSSDGLSLESAAAACGSGSGGGTECSTSSCNLNASTTLNSQGVCLANGTNCPPTRTPLPTYTPVPSATPVPSVAPADCGAGNGVQAVTGGTPKCFVIPTPDGAGAGAPGAGTYIDVSGSTVSVDPTEINDVTYGDNTENAIDVTFDSLGTSDVTVSVSQNALAINLAAVTLQNGNVLFKDGSGNGVTFTSSSDTLAAAGTGVLQANDVACTGCVGTTDVASTIALKGSDNAFSVLQTFGAGANFEGGAATVTWADQPGNIALTWDPTANTNQGMLAATGTGTLRANDVACTACVSAAELSFATMTPIPTYTPVPSATPVPSYTPIPSITAGAGTPLPISTSTAAPGSAGGFARIDHTHQIPAASLGPDKLAAVDFGDFTCNGTTCTNDANSITLTTDTVGNYVQSVATGTGLTGGAAGSEGAVLTLAFDYSLTHSDDPALNANECIFGTNGLLCEGTSADTREVTIRPQNPISAGDVTYTIGGNVPGTYAIPNTGDTGVITGGMLVNDTLTATQIAAGAIGSSELASTAVSAGSYTSANITVDADGRLTSAADGIALDVTDIYVSKNGTDSSDCGAVFKPCLTITGANGAHAKISGEDLPTCTDSFETNCNRCATGSASSPTCSSNDDCSAGHRCSYYTCSNDNTRACSFKCTTATTTECMVDAHCPLGDTCNLSSNNCSGGGTCTNANGNSACPAAGFCGGQNHTYRVIFGQGTWSECLSGTNHARSGTVYMGSGRYRTIITCATGPHDFTDVYNTDWFDLSPLSGLNGSAAIKSTGSMEVTGFERINTGPAGTKTNGEPGILMTGMGNHNFFFNNNQISGGYGGTGAGCFKTEIWPGLVCTHDATVPCNSIGDGASCFRSCIGGTNDHAPCSNSSACPSGTCAAAAGTCTNRTCFNATTRVRSNPCAIDADCAGGAVCRPMRSAYDYGAVVNATSTERFIQNNLFQCVGLDNATSVDVVAKAGGYGLNVKFINNVFFNGEKATTVKICQGGANVSEQCTVDSQCPTSTCAVTSLGSTYDLRVRRTDGTGSNLKVAALGNTFITDAASAVVPPTDFDMSIETGTTLYDQGNNAFDATRNATWTGTYTMADAGVAGGGSADRGALLSAPVSPQSGWMWRRIDGALHQAYVRLNSVSEKLMTDPLTAKGSLVAGQASARPVERTVGTDGQILVADSAQTSGLNWQTHNSTGDPHTQYQKEAGDTGAQALTISSNNAGTLNVSGGNGAGTVTVGSGSSNGTIYGTTGSGGTLTLASTSNGTKGGINFGNSQYDDQNNRLQIGAANCTAPGNAPACVTGDMTVSAPGTGTFAVVGRTATQTLTNKTLTTPTIGDFTNATHTHSGTTSGGQLYAYENFRTMRMAAHASNTQYGGYANVSTLEAWASNILSVPAGGTATIKRLYCDATAAPANGAGTQTFAMTMRVNAADCGGGSPLTCTMSEAATTCNDTTNSCTAVSGDLIDIKFVPSGTPATGTGGVTCAVVIAMPLPSSQP